MTRELYDACCALLNAPHPDHFASRLGDAEFDALSRIQIAVAAIQRKQLTLVKCDGNHAGAPCGDKECWLRDDDAPITDTMRRLLTKLDALPIYQVSAQISENSHVEFTAVGKGQVVEAIRSVLNTSPPIDGVLTRTEDDLTFHELIFANLSRVERWHSLLDWSPLEWAGAMCGEAGEAANYAKKFKRVETDIANHDKRLVGDLMHRQELLNTYRQGIGHEVADVIIYGVLLCARVNVDLVKCIREAFNTKSAEYGFPERL